MAKYSEITRNRLKILRETRRIIVKQAGSPRFARKGLCAALSRARVKHGALGAWSLYDLGIESPPSVGISGYWYPRTDAGDKRRIAKIDSAIKRLMKSK